MSNHKVGAYSFTPAIIYDEAKPPEDPGVYMIMLQGPNGGRPAIRYIGKASNLKQRLRLDPEHYQKLYQEARNIDRIYLSWHVISPRSGESMAKAIDRVDNELIARFGKQLDNSWKNTPTWKERQDKDRAS